MYLQIIVIRATPQSCYLGRLVVPCGKDIVKGKPYPNLTGIAAAVLALGPSHYRGHRLGYWPDICDGIVLHRNIYITGSKCDSNSLRVSITTTAI